MSGKPALATRVGTVASWPFGIALTSWHYMWRTTPMHRSEEAGSEADLPPPLPSGLRDDRLQLPEHGVGPLFHRRYVARTRQPRLSPEKLIETIGADPNCVSPTEFARFRKLGDAGERLLQNDELVVRMPGPWDGPVRVAEVSPCSFRLVTLRGHLEAGQIEFHASEADGEIVFRIESWARSSDRLSHLLYHHLHMAKEVQLHMWSSFLERIGELAGAGVVGGIEIVTRRLDDPDAVS